MKHLKVQVKFACTITMKFISLFLVLIHRFQKKPEVTPKRGLIALAIDTHSNKHGERSGKASLSSNIPEELTD